MKRAERISHLMTLACVLVLLLCCAVLPKEAQAAEVMDGTVRVWLASLGNPSEVDITVCGSYSLNGIAINNGTQLKVSFASSTGRLTLNMNGSNRDMGSSFTLKRHQLSGINGLKIQQARQKNNVYPADLEFYTEYASGGYKLYVIAHVFVEDYLYGVVPYEIGSSAPLEAMKAQSICARTYAARAMKAQTGKKYDVQDTTQDQVYNGTPVSSTLSEQAVNETRGIVLSINGDLTGTYYTASNGGQIDSPVNIWGSNSILYLTVRDDPYDYANTAAQVKSFTVVKNGIQTNSTLNSLLVEKAKKTFGANNVTINSVSGILPHTPRYSAPSRLYTKLDFDVSVTADGVKKSGTLSFDIFSELEAPLSMSINSGNNELWTVNDQGSTFTVQARRFGHGTGMSQRGAMTMARQGYRYDEILAFYFPGSVRTPYTFVSSVLPPVNTGSVTPILSSESAAAIDNAGCCYGVVYLSSMQTETALRLSASDTSDILAGIPHGAVVHVLARYGEWALIRYRELTGYIQYAALSVNGTIPATAAPATVLYSYGRITNNSYLNLRAGTSTSTESLA